MPDQAPRRRLPLLGTQGAPDVEPARPAWQWVGLGTVAIFVVWLPLSALAAVVAERSYGAASDRGVAAAVFVIASGLALAFAATAGGFVMGKWGGPAVGPRQAALAGLLAAVVAVAASWASFGFATSSLVVALIALPFAALGGWLGRRRFRR